MTGGIVKKKAGQSQKLTSLLRDLVRRYPKTIGIFNEFLQNADDAQARSVRFILDHRTHTASRLPAPEMRQMLGPALLIANDSQFSEEDFERIQQIGDSGKLMAVAKTGRFGFGFNSAYNITDYPSFLSGEWVYFFDPHRDSLPEGEPGVAYTITPELWATWPDLLTPFVAAGLKPGAIHHDGTVFRLPLRSPERAAKSEIRDEPFTVEDFRALSERFTEVADDSLLFLRHVLGVEVGEIPDDSTGYQQLLAVVTNNATEVMKSRAVMNVSTTKPLSLSLLQELSDSPPAEVFEHHFTINRRGSTEQSKWLVASGVYFDEDGELIESARAMFGAGEKAIPWVGVAAALDPLTEPCSPKRISGQAFSFLPLPISTGLPVHINGFFDLGSDRRTLTHDPNSLGRDEIRVKWNELLCDLAIPMAYRAALLRMVERSVEPTAFYDIWPDVGGIQNEPLPLVGGGLYRACHEDALIMAATPGEPEWRPIGGLWIPPSQNHALQDALVADGVGIPLPPLPTHIIAGFEHAELTVDHLTPAMLREELRVEHDIDTVLENAPRRCLQRREWVETLLRFCLASEGSAEQLAGLPLAILADKKLHTFGKFSWNWSFMAADAERRILASHPQWFIDPAFATSTGLPKSQSGHVSEMGPSGLALNLPVVLDPQRKGDPVPWTTSGRFGSEWLTDLFTYLAEHSKDVLPSIQGWKVKPPLLPDQQSRLCPPCLPISPLLIPPEVASNRRLLRALDAFCIPRIEAPPPLLGAIERFAQATGGSVIRTLTGPTLAATLKEMEPRWRTAVPDYDAELHHPILEFLSDERWLSAPSALSAIKGLAIFPTEDGKLVRLTEPDVFFTPDAPPKLSCQVKLLRLGQHRRWKGLFRALGANALDHEALIKSVLLPQYAQADARQKLSVLQWIRDHLASTVKHLETAKPESAVDLRRIVAAAPLFQCTDGVFRKASAVYDPAQNIVRELLGHSAPTPDRTVYHEDWPLWLSFLQYLDMPKHPVPQDLLAAVDRLVTLGPDSPEAADRADRLLQYFGENPKILTDSKVADTAKNGQLRPLGEALADRAWLRAEADPKRLGRYAGARVPEVRLFRPAELYSVRSAHLCASQCPISAHAKIRADLAKALGMPARVPDEVVVDHFEHILTQWGLDDHGGLTARTIEPSLKMIYRRLGGSRDAEAGDDDLDEGDPEPVQEASSTHFKARFARQPCLWDWETKQQFWTPEHVFRSRVACFGKFRAAMRFTDASLDRGYEALGRRDEPSAADFVAFLRDVAAECPDGVPPALVQNVLGAQARLVQSAAAETVTVPLDELFLLDSARRMVPADTGYYCDADWYRDRLEPGRVSLLFQPGTDYGLVRQLGVRVLSEVLTEELLETGRRSADLDLLRRSARWQTSIRSTEFRSGLTRLIRSAPDNEGQEVDLDWLSTATLQLVDRITTQLLIERDQGPVIVGTGECEVFVDRGAPGEPTTIYLASLRDARLESSLTRGLLHQLSPLRIDRQLELQEIITCDPEHIDALLTQRRVPRTTDVEVLLHEEETPSDAIELSSDDFGGEPESELEPADMEDVDPVVQPDPPGGDASADEDAPRPIDRPSGTPSTRPPTAAVPVPASAVGSGSGADADRPSAHEANGVAGKPALRASPSNPPSAAPVTDGAKPGVNGPRHSGPPTADTHGQRTNASKSPRPRRGRAITYVIPVDTPPSVPRDPADDEQPANMKISLAAVDHALRVERKDLGRLANPMAHNQKGYDILSTATDGTDARYIEVKGIDGAWSEDGVPLSRPQFEMGQQFGDAYWLYVVENARSPDAVVHRIQNPAGKVSQFRFDLGWQAMAASGTAPKEVPVARDAAGRVPALHHRIRWSDRREGKITAVQQRGQLYHLHVALEDGATVRGLFDPANMTLLGE